MYNYHTERAQNVNVHSGISGSGLHTVCVPRDLLAAVWGKHGTSSGGRSVFVLDGLARISRRVHPLFVLCSPGVLHPATFPTVTVTVVRGAHGTSSGGRSLFLARFERGICFSTQEQPFYPGKPNNRTFRYVNCDF